MKIILQDEVLGLGEEGDVVMVSDGFARNYLFPAKKAILHNTQNMAILTSQQHAIKKRKEERKIVFMSIKEKLEHSPLTIKMKTGDSGHLFGAVTSTVIAEHLAKQDINIPKKQIVIPHHTIKEIGTYDIEVKLVTGMNATLKVIVEDIEGKINKIDNKIVKPEIQTTDQKSKEEQSVLASNDNTISSKQDIEQDPEQDEDT